MKQIYILSFLLTACTGIMAQGTWTTQATMPATGRAFSYVFSVGDTGYVCGGLNLGVVQTDFWAYNAITDTWVQKSTPAYQARQGVTFTINNKAYLCMGMKNGSTTPSSEIWEYDPSNNSWTQKGNFPGTARISAYGFTIGTKGYLGGGSNTQPGGSLYDFWEYNPSNDLWTQIPNCPVTEYLGFGTFSVNGYGYVVGGFGNSPATLPLNKVWRFDPSNNQWTQKNNFPINLGLTTGFSVNGEGYIVNGATQLGSNQSKINSLYKYNSSTDSWALQSPFPGAVRSSTHVLVIGNSVYAGHGLGLSSIYYSDWYKYVPSGITSVNETINDNLLSLYPNPATDKILVPTEYRDQEGVITDMHGRILMHFDGVSSAINISGLSDGIYLLKIANKTQRFVISH